MRKINEKSNKRGILGNLEAMLKATVFGSVILLPMPSYSANDCLPGTPCSDDLDFLLDAEEKVEISPGRKGAGVSISVDGEPIFGEISNDDLNRQTDVDLENVDIQIKYDGLGANRQLAVSTVPEKRIHPVSEPIEFFANWNYPDWTTRAEIRIYENIEQVQNPSLNIPIAILDVSPDGRAYWQPYDEGEEKGKHFNYTVRVYDDAGRFDETSPLPLKVGDNLENSIFFAEGEGEDVRGFIERRPESENPGYLSNNLAVSNIPLHGGVVTVYGKNIPAGVYVNVQGENVPIAKGDDFVSQRILAPGDHKVDVEIYTEDGQNSVEFQRDIYIPDNEWFYVGLADLTIGKRFGHDSSQLAPVLAGEYDDVYKRGRLAFYLKGKVKGKYLITAALDTTEENLDEIFSNLDKKDPRQLLRRLDPDDYYPIYGDDSTIHEDAPTSGRFYVRIERGKSHVMWGNFKTKIDGVEFARYQRSLYGAHAVLKTEETTSFGEPISTLRAFAAQPDTLPQRDEFKGTGGSAYFLRRQDINPGSEQIIVEIRDQTTGLVIERKTLKEGVDYTVDYVQGVLILSSPLNSTVSSGGAVLPSPISSYEQYLVVTYEYAPTLEDVDGFSYGGRLSTWIDDQFQIGVSGYHESTGQADQNLYGADFTWRLSEKSYFQFEWAQSEGDNFAFVKSTDGGLIFTPVSGDDLVAGKADAWRVRLHTDLAEATGDLVEGSFGVGYEEREAGFNAPGRYTPIAERILDAHLIVKPSEDLTFTAKYDQVDRANGVRQLEADAEIKARINEQFTVQAGVQHSDIQGPSTSSDGTGRRTDVGARLTWHGLGDEEIYVFGQTTVDKDATRDRNDRYGVGFKADLSDKLSADGEVSWGTSGLGLMAGLNYQPTAQDRYYIGYRLAPYETVGGLNSYDPFGRDNGAIVLGMRKALSETTIAFAEHNYDFMGTTQGLTHTYGVEYAPDAIWKFTAGIEAGHVRDENNADFDRWAPSASVRYKEEGKYAYARLEARFEDSVDNTRDRTTWLAEADLGLRYDDNWRFLASLDLVLSDSDQTSVLDADYIEGSVGWAYRPIDNDRFNALFKYTYLHDLPGNEQVNADGVIGGPKQRSHILSADFIYDVNKYLSVGAKYGMRVGEISTDRTSDNFVKSSAHLGVLRADIHVVKNWDILLEGRALWLSELDQVNYGALAGVYRHIGENLKVGVGYNFGRFSDKMSDLTLDDEGFFINVIGKF